MMSDFASSRNAAQDRENIAWTRNLYDAMRTWSAGSVYVNALSEDDGARVREAFGANFDRLCKITRAEKLKILQSLEL
jgi:hypothetical protein